MKRPLLPAIFACLALALILGAQTKPKPPAGFADFGPWESLASAGARGGFSPDGRWLVYAINRSNRSNELRILKLADGTTKTAAFGALPAFSEDSKWLAYSIGVSEAEQDRMRADNRPVQNKLALMNLATGAATTWDGIESFAFSPDGSSLALQRYAPSRPVAPAAPAGGARGARGGR